MAQQQQQQGQYPTYPPRQHHHHQAYRSSAVPLQTIANQHSNVSTQPPKEQQMVGAQEKETPKQQKPSAKKPSKTAFPLLKSPITMCFERMLGAGESSLLKLFLVLPYSNIETHLHVSCSLISAADFIAQNPHVVAKEEKKQQYKTAPRRGSKRKSVNGAAQEKPSKPKKRLSTVNPAPLTASDLAPGNPFLEILQDPDLHHQVVLQMALQREPSNKEIPASPPSIIPEGFYWRDYPVLEQILFDNMAEYYHISSLNRQSKFQQAFNNKLVGIIQQKASENNLSFDRTSFDDKKLRDRVRCFFKTHLQNAKKRLGTLQKHPESEEHQKQLRNFIKCAKEHPLLEMFEKLPKKRRVKASVAPVV